MFMFKDTSSRKNRSIMSSNNNVTNRQKPSAGSDWGAFRRVILLAKPHAGKLCIGLLALAGGAAINLLLPEVIRRILNQPEPGYLAAHSIEIGFALILLFAIQALCFYFRSFFFGVVGQRVVASIRDRLYTSIIRQDIEFFDSNRVGDLVSRISSDCSLLQDAVSLRLSVFIRYGIQVSAGIVLMSLISLRLTFAIVLTLPVLIGFSIVLGKRLKALSRLQQKELGLATNIAEETISGVRIVNAFNRQEYEGGRFQNAANKVLDAGIQRTGVAAFFASFVSFIMNGCIVVIMLYGVTLVSSDSLTIGDLSAFMLYGLIVAVSFSFLSSGYAEFVQALGAAERVFEVIDRQPPPPTRGEPEALATSAEKKAGDILFEGASFSYPSRPDIEVLSKVSFQVPSGKTVALVGPSGAGKSTIVNLLLRFYDPAEGEILFDGVDIRDVTPADLRKQIAIVPQETELFATSIAENLRYGKGEATLDELRDVAKKASLLEFIEGLPDGFDTPVGERGVQLSGGQKQRLAIARAMLRNPRLLILDEATSSLDSENEHLVQLALGELMSGRSALVIAHRLSTIRNADSVIVLDNGKVVQSGTHDELCESPGLYQQLVKRQDLLRDENGSKPEAVSIS
jgi:ATP-binding cassette subfamily B protein